MGNTIDAHTKGGTLESGTAFKEKLDTTPSKQGMDPGNGANQRVPATPKTKVAGGQTIK